MPESTKDKREILHATCVSAGSVGVLLLGPSGSGKSDLALRLISRGHMLVADDRTVLCIENGHLAATVEEEIRGLLEVRGVGLLEYPVANHIPVRLVVELVSREEMERIPEPSMFECLGRKVPKIAINGFDSSSPDKILAALRALVYNRVHTGFAEKRDG